MDEVFVLFSKLIPTAIPPKVSQTGDVAADLFAAEEAVVTAWGRQLIRTGIALELPPGYRASIRSRSGLSLKWGIEAGAGLIDQSYRHEIGVLLYNHSEEDFMVRPGDRIAQICIERYSIPHFSEVESVEATTRTEGWGSSGR